jgi:hypothetical protein
VKHLLKPSCIYIIICYVVVYICASMYDAVVYICISIV